VDPSTLSTRNIVNTISTSIAAPIEYNPGECSPYPFAPNPPAMGFGAPAALLAKAGVEFREVHCTRPVAALVGV
jgi:hypothetical protein